MVGGGGGGDDKVDFFKRKRVTKEAYKQKI